LNSYLDCYPCLVRHAIDASRHVTEDIELQKKVLNGVFRLLAELPFGLTPVRMAAQAHAIIRKELGVDDAYIKVKKMCNGLAMDLLPDLCKKIESADDPLEVAVRIAIAGNIIDFGALGESFDLDAALQDSLTSPLGIDNYRQFKEDLQKAKKVVYVGDNTGEIAFDRLLVEQIQRRFNPEIVFVVRGTPILNDATIEDARAVGLADLVEVIPSGGDVPGCELESSPEVRSLFETADLVISKGQGNYEALSLEPYPIYFLLRIKCKVIAMDIGGVKDTGVVKRSDHYQWNDPGM